MQIGNPYEYKQFSNAINAEGSETVEVGNESQIRISSSPLKTNKLYSSFKNQEKHFAEKNEGNFFAPSNSFLQSKNYEQNKNKETKNTKEKITTQSPSLFSSPSFSQPNKQKTKNKKSFTFKLKYVCESEKRFNDRGDATPFFQSIVQQARPFEPKFSFNVVSPGVTANGKSQAQIISEFKAARRFNHDLSMWCDRFKSQQERLSSNYSAQYAAWLAHLRSGDGKSGEVVGTNLDARDLEFEKEYVEQVPQLFENNNNKQQSSFGGFRFQDGKFCRIYCNAEQGIVEVDLCKESQGNLQGFWAYCDSCPEPVYCGQCCGIMWRRCKASCPRYSTSTSATLQTGETRKESAPSVVNLSGNQDSVSLGGYCGVAQKELCDLGSKVGGGGSPHYLGQCGEEHKNETVSSNRFDCGEGKRVGQGFTPESEASGGEDEGRRVVVSNDNKSDGKVVEKGSVDQKSFLSLFQKSLGGKVDFVRVGGNVGSSFDSSGVEAPRSVQSDHGQLHSLQQQQGSSGKSVGVAKGNSSVVKNNNNNKMKSRTSSSVLPKVGGVRSNNNNNNSNPVEEARREFDHMNYNLFENYGRTEEGKLMNHSFTRRTHSSKLSTPEQQQTLPLHSSDVSGMKLNINNVINNMAPSKGNRLQKLVYLIERDFPAYIQQKALLNNNISPFADIPSNNFPVADAQKLVADSVAASVPSSLKSTTMCYGIPFDVVEQEKGKGERRRFIFWTKIMNEWLSEVAKYEPDLKNLKFQNTYLDEVNSDVAVTGDLKISFFQFLLPESVRPYFRFVDAEGNLYEMLRLPMGLRISPEIMQLVCEFVAGEPKVLNSYLANKQQQSLLQKSHVSIKVWIDGFQVACSKENAEALKQQIEYRGKIAGVVFKDPGVLVETRYTFCGVEFCHEDKTVRVADKTLNKLPSTPFVTHQNLRTSELEKLVSRLIFCSSVVRIILGDYFFLLKWANRQIAYFNESHVDRLLSLPSSVCNSLNHWIKSARKTLCLQNSNNNKFFDYFDVLFVDASTWGWGAYFISSSGEIAIGGGKWEDEILDREGYNINVLEALAVHRALLYFEDRLMQNCNVDIRVDNTSSLHSLLKSKSKSSAALNEHVVNSVNFLVTNGFSYTLQYVNTKDNWADGPSRGKGDVVNPTTKQIAEVLCYENRGILGRQAVNTSVSLSQIKKMKKND